MKGLKFRKALVTGGTRGIGKAIAERLLIEGCDVTITGRGARPNSGASYVAVDFLTADSIDGFLNTVEDGKYDIVINNAGINKAEPFIDIDDDTFQNIQLVNLSIPFKVIKKALPHMMKVGYGRIVNIGSIFGVISKANRASYSASKFGLDGMTTALSAEVASRGILANTVAPGFIETDLTKSVLSQEEIDFLVEQVPVGRLGTVDEVASFVAYLASEENTFITGQCLAIDGGYTRV